MTTLIDQLFTIATNEEFSPEQRKELMDIALDEALGLPPVPSEPLNQLYAAEFIAAYEQGNSIVRAIADGKIK